MSCCVGDSQLPAGDRQHDLLQEAGGRADHRVWDLATHLEECGSHLQFLHLGLVQYGGGQLLVHQAHQKAGGLGRLVLGDADPPGRQTYTW